MCEYVCGCMSMYVVVCEYAIVYECDCEENARLCVYLCVCLYKYVYIFRCICVYGCMCK